MRSTSDNVITPNATNCRRQIEFDYMKGIFMPFIFLIHAFQGTCSDMGDAVSVIYIIATMTGAAIYIFVLGFGTGFGNRANPSRLAKRGITFVAYQYMTNLLYVIALLIPYPFVKDSLTEDGAGLFSALIRIYPQFINIFFITGIIYLVLAVLKKLNVPAWGYAALAVITALLAPVIYGSDIDIPVIGYVSRLIIGEDAFVSFTPLYYLPYALIGFAVGNCYRNMSDKRRFYKRLLPAGIIVSVIWWVSVFVRLSRQADDLGYEYDIESFRNILDGAYSCPDIWHVVASLAHIAVLAALLYFFEEYRKSRSSHPEERGVILRQILYYNNHITAYYAIHLCVYLLALGIHGYTGFGVGACLILTLISMIVTETVVRSYDVLHKIISAHLVK